MTGHPAIESTITCRLRDQGIDAARLRRALDSGDRWGQLVHAHVYLAVLDTVAAEMEREEAVR